MFNKKNLFMLLFPLLLLSLSGCGGDPDTPDLGTVTGRVTMDGKALANVAIAFFPDSGGRYSLAGTDEKGYYELEYSRTAKGAKIGPHTIRITTPTDGPPPPGKEPKDPIPAKYNKKSELKREVKLGKNQFDFDLKSK